MKLKLNKTYLKIIIALVIALVAIIEPNTSFGWNLQLGNKISIGMDEKGKNTYKLAGTDNLYCIQHDAFLNSNTKNIFEVQKYIYIEGNKATMGNKTTSNSSNSMMSYILTGGTWTKQYGTKAGVYYPRQVAIYKYWNTWARESGLGLTTYEKNEVNGNDEVTKILNAAKKYAEGNNTNYKPASIKATTTNVNVTGSTKNTKIGPFKVTYTGNATLEVYNTNGSKISNNNIEIYNESGKKIGKIPSNENFYIKNNSNSEVNNVKVKVSSKLLTTKIWILGSTNGKQQLMAVEPGTKNVSVDVTIKVTRLGDLTVIKVDENTSAKIKMGFKVRTSKKDNSGNYLWLKGTAGKYSYVSFNNADTYYTSTSGKKLKKLDASIKYQVWETKTASKYYVLAEQTGYDKNLNAVNLTGKDKWISVNQASTTRTYKNTPTKGNLNIVKEDSSTAKKLTGMKFKIRLSVKNSKGDYYWLKVSNGTYKYTATTKISDATEFTIKSASGYSLNNLATNIRYQVFETEAPKGFKLSEQDNYGKEEKGAVNLTGKGKWITLNKSQTVTVEYQNNPEDEDISISGKIWIDLKSKDDVYNNLYNTGEELYKNATVELVNKSTNKVIATVKATNGQYTFKNKVKYSKLKDYYVRFKYSNEYIPVAYDTKNTANGSRALVSAMEESDKDIKAIATTYPEKNKESIYGLSAYAKTSLYNKSTKTLENINLGLKEIYKPQYDLVEDVKYIKIVTNNHSYIYQYGEELDSISTATPTVKFENKASKTYSSSFYPADLYNFGNNNGKLEVYVIYGIAVRNTTNYKNEEQYVEKELVVTKLTSKFDTDRYQVDTTVNNKDNLSEIEKNINQDDLTKWTTDEDGTTTYTGGSFTVTPEEKYKTKYIQFKVKENAIKAILENPKGISEKHPTSSISNAYHNYTRNDYSWENLKKHNTLKHNQTHKTNSAEEKDDAPYLSFKLGENRILTGTVFEDGVITTDGRKLGNGAFDNNEKVLSGVKVRLVSADNNEIAKIYNDDNKSGINAEAVTDENGKFTFVGVIPDEYYIIYSYGDLNYKSTIVTSSVTKNALGYSANSFGNEWYKHLEGNNYSVAIDNLNLRVKYNGGDTSIQEMQARTPRIDITIENTIEQYMSYNESKSQYSTFEGFNFGIIEQPKQKIEIEKIITNIKLVNDPTIIFDGNPETASLKGVSDLDGKTNGGSSYVRVEIEAESIYGSTLTLKYQIKVTNTSDINYYETNSERFGWYYWFGEIDSSAKEYEINVDELRDYLDSTLQYVSSSSETSIKTLQDDEGKTYYAFTGIPTLARNSSQSVTLEAKKVLSVEDDDMYVTNIAKINKLSNVISKEITDEQYAAKVKNLTMAPEIPEQAEADATVTEPTGLDKKQIIIYTATGSIMLIVLIAGIMIIKKKIL